MRGIVPATQETAEFSLTAEVEQPGGSALCPFNCSSHGTCASPGACACDVGWQGAFCQVCSCCPGPQMVLLLMFSFPRWPISELMVSAGHIQGDGGV